VLGQDKSLVHKLESDSDLLELKTSIVIPNVEVKADERLDANINLVRHPSSLERTASSGTVGSVGSSDPHLDLLRTLIHSTFINTTAREYNELQKKLAEFSRIIADKDTQNVEFVTNSGPYRLTVRGQVPVKQSVVLVIDVERLDGKEFRQPEKEVLQGYTFQLHFQDTNTKGKLQDQKNAPVQLTTQGGKSKHSMSCGFWPFYRTGEIRTSLKWNYHLGETQWVPYSGGSVEPGQIKKNIVIDLVV